MKKPRWTDEVADHDYTAAYQYLSLLLDRQRANLAVNALRALPITSRRCNDILRASDRDPLPQDDPGVTRALQHIQDSKPLSPILIVSFDHGADIADGYHRASAIYHDNPFLQVPCKLAYIPTLEHGSGFSGQANL